MNKSTSQIQAALAAALGAMPDVFSAVQWGGRAYKLPGPGSRGKRKPLLLAHVWLEKDESGIGVAFKLPPARAQAMVRTHVWIAPHSFRTLAPSGWVTASIRTKAQCKTLIELLRESRALHPIADATSTESNPTARRGNRDADGQGDATIRRIDAILNQRKEEGWRVRDDEFDR